MKRTPLRVKPLPSPRVEIINLIDVLITLVAFFLLTTVFAGQKTQLNIELPVAASAKLQKEQPKVITIEVTKTDHLALNGEMLSKELLKERLITLPAESVIVIKADKECRYEWIIDLMNTLSRAQFKKVAFEVKNG